MTREPVDVTIRAHDALEAYLRRDAETAADWLWLHERWKFAYKPHKRFRLPERRNQVARANTLHGRDALPRKVRFWVRLPDTPPEVVEALPVLRAIRTARPDFAVTLIGEGGLQSLVEASEVADRFGPLPKSGLSRWLRFYQMRSQYPDTYLVLAEGFGADLEAFLTRCPQRFGVERAGRRRRLLTTPYRAERGADEASPGSFQVWQSMAHFYGLPEPEASPPNRPKSAADG